MRLRLRILIVLCSLFGVLRSQIAIINYDFNSGTSYASLTPLTAPSISGTVTSTETFATLASGQQTGTSNTSFCQGYASNAAGSAITSTNLNSGSHSFTFQLGGANLACYKSFKVYFDVRSTSSGPPSVNLQYSITGATYTTSATSYSGLNVPGSTWMECNFDLSGITALDNQSSLYLKIVPSLASAAGATFSIDNFQVQAVQSSCFPVYTLGPNALSVYSSETAAGSNIGCDGNCDQTAFNMYYATCATGGTTGTCQSSGSSTEYPVWASLDIPSSCSATITAEYGYPYSQTAGMCPDSRMDGSDVVGISIGTSTTTNDGTCSFNSATSAAGATGSTGVVVGGCTGTGNADQSVTLVIAGPNTATIWGTMNRSDEVIIYSAQVSTAACYTTVVTTVLPIELISFVAYRMADGNVQLKWATETETNNDYFEVEYSYDARNFTSYSKVKGAGTSYVKKEYSSVFNGSNTEANSGPYFRLKQVDNDGKFKYSPIILVGSSWGTKNNSKTDIKAFYNSEKDQVMMRFHLEYPQLVNIVLYDLNGMVLSKISQLGHEGDNELELNAPNEGGLYLLVYQNGNGSPVHKKVMVRK